MIFSGEEKIKGKFLSTGILNICMGNITLSDFDFQHKIFQIFSQPI